MQDNQTPQTTRNDKDKLTKWKNEPTLYSLKSDLLSTKDHQSAQVAKIQEWSDLMNVTGSASPKGKGSRLRSTVQPRLIKRQAEWRYSALSEPFQGQSKLFSVYPVTFEDEAAAKQNEVVLNYQFNNKLNKVKFIDDFVRANVDEGTCICRIGWNRNVDIIEKEVPVWDYFELTDPLGIELLQQALELKQSNPRGYEEEVPEDMKAALEYSLENDVLVFAEQSGTTVVETEDVKENCPTVDILNPQNVYIDPSCQGDLDKALFVIVSFETNKAELMKEKDKYKNLDKVDWEGATPAGESDFSTNTPESFNFTDKARKKVVAYEYWGFYDIHKNNKLVPIVATWIGDVLIRMDENPFPDQKLPFVVTTYLPVKRSLYGEPDAELLKENQAIIGATTRGMIDLLAKSANSQQGFAKGVLDASNYKNYMKGNDYEYNPNNYPNNGLIQHTYPEIPNSAMNLITLMNEDAEGLTGIKSFAGGLAGNAYGNVATGIRTMVDAAAKREMAILRRLAKGIKDIGVKIAAMNAVFLSEEETVRITNKEFVVVKREDLKGNFDLDVDISTTEIDDMKAQDLSFLMQASVNVVEPQVYLYLLGKIAGLKRMPEVEELLTTWQPTPDPVEEEKKQLELEQLRLENQRLQSEIELNAAKAAKAREEADAEALDTMQNLDGTKHERELAKQKAQSKGNIDLNINKALTAPRKPGETPPDIMAALGHSVLADSRDAVRTPAQRDVLAQTDGAYNINSGNYDPSLDPLVNPNINL